MRRHNNRLSSILFVSCVCVAATLILLFPKQTTMPASSQQQGPGRRSFPVGFLFGTASASYQYEGAANEGGRGPSIWDTFAHTPGKIQDGSNGDVAADEYHRYKEDIQLVKNMGMDAYRFSVSWSRILPKGTVEGGINKVGIEYYNNLINELLKNGIKPFITLFHWDLPQALEDKYGGFRSKEIVNDFRAFATICFKEFGDRVKNWITLNEPWSFACISYDYGTMAPGRCSKFVRNCTAGDSAREPYIVAHNLLLAHASAVEYYRSDFQATQKGSIGISLNCHWMMPFSEHSDHQEAAQRAIDFMFGWFMDPIAKGEYPSSMRLLAGDRLPHFTEKEASILRGSFDFLGINYYTSRYVLHVPEKPDPAWTSYTQDSQTTLTTEKNGVKLGSTGASDWLYVYPNGLKELLLYTKRQYNNPAVYITENGIDEFNNESTPLQDALNDRWRIEYYELHLEAVKQAVKDGANVRGYFAWSLLDNFEWHMGYTLRFGLHFVDFKNGLARYPKASARWFSYFLSGASN